MRVQESNISRVLRVACVQLNAREDKAANLQTAEKLVAEAAARGAELVLLPEKWNAYGTPEVARAAAEPLEGGESVEAMRSWARAHGITLVGGSITELRPGHERCSNTCVVFDPTGAPVAVYRKIHMFDVEVGGHVYRESDAEEPGTDSTVCSAAGWELGLTICYDLRFPELYRLLALAGAELVVVPSAFTLVTGRDHWEVLLRARSIENQCFTAAANQWGAHNEQMTTGGRSMIVDPWGVVRAQAADQDAVIWADIDARQLLQIREKLPSLANRRPDAYRAPVMTSVATEGALR